MHRQPGGNLSRRRRHAGNRRSPEELARQARRRCHPDANSKYLEAVLGKDLTAKRDSSVKRSSAESSRPGLFGFFGIFGRRPEPPAKNNTSTSANTIASAKDADSTAADAGGSSASVTKPNSSTQADDLAKKGDAASGARAAKKDDAIQKATADDPDPPPRRRLFDFLRPRDD